MGIEKVKRLSREETLLRTNNRRLRQKSGDNERIRRLLISESESSMDMDDDSFVDLFYFSSRPELLRTSANSNERTSRPSEGNTFTDSSRPTSLQKDSKVVFNLGNINENPEEGSAEKS
ncbi:uncharacterized protein LOC118761113 [Octopus sinensis]|uniref:Uncharacterized protein LOC118761113 n=1 Tax=Octopus sinensis TaxID=2607531 RepID=A0A7E6EIH2_9MOLL|nr:uncharacterized protein LOC118761113 [Octopus sinensis]